MGATGTTIDPLAFTGATGVGTMAVSALVPLALGVVVVVTSGRRRRPR